MLRKIPVNKYLGTFFSDAAIFREFKALELSKMKIFIRVSNLCYVFLPIFIGHFFQKLLETISYILVQLKAHAGLSVFHTFC